MSTSDKINEAIVDTLAAADNVINSVSTLTDLILTHRPGLISDATVVREAAALLMHAVQNFSRTANATIDSNSSGNKGSRT